MNEQGNDERDALCNKVFPPVIYVHFFQSGADLKAVTFGPYFGVSVRPDADWSLEVTESFPGHARPEFCYTLALARRRILATLRPGGTGLRAH